METGLGEVVAAMRERFKRPFYWAFLFSWFIVNWRIWLVFVAYDNTNCTNGIIECVTSLKQFTFEYLFCWPLFGALIYTIILPFIDLIVTWFNIKCIRNKYYKIIYNKSTLHSGLDIEIRDKDIAKLKEENTQLQKLMAENSNLSSSLSSVRSENRKLVENNERNMNRFDVSTFFGQWNVKFRRNDSEPYDSAIFKFDNNTNNVVSLYKIERSILTKWFEIRAYSIEHNEYHYFMLYNAENNSFGLLTLKEIENKSRSFSGSLNAPGTQFEFGEIEFEFIKD